MTPSPKEKQSWDAYTLVKFISVVIGTLMVLGGGLWAASQYFRTPAFASLDEKVVTIENEVKVINDRVSVHCSDITRHPNSELIELKLSHINESLLRIEKKFDQLETGKVHTTKINSDKE